MDDFNAVNDCVKEISPLWEGQETMQGMQLARNLLVHLVLQDEWLKDQAVSLAHSWLSSHTYTMKRHRYWFS